MGINNTFKDALAKAGIQTTKANEAIDENKQTLEMKLNQVKIDVNGMSRHAERYNSAPETYEFFAALDGIDYRVNSVAHFIIDIAEIMYEKIDNKTLTSEFSLGRSIRYIKSTLNLDKTEESVIDKLNSRNALAHDYVNSEVHKLDIAEFFSDINHRKSLKSIINKIDTYLNENNLK